MVYYIPENTEPADGMRCWYWIGLAKFYAILGPGFLVSDGCGKVWKRVETGAYVRCDGA